ARTLTFTGTNTGANLFAPIIADGVGSTAQTSVAKTAAGVWYVSATNTYSGTTTLNGGTFGAKAANSLSPNSTIVFAGSTTLDDSSFAQTVAGITLNDVAGMTATLANAPVANPITTPFLTFVTAQNGNTTTLTGGNINIPANGLFLDASGY